MSSAIASASSRSVVAAPCGCAIESERINASNARRSSARSMLAMLLPRMVTPARSSGSARLIAVWPPNCTTTPDACSSSMIARDRLLVERLEVQARAAVEVGAHRLRVAVDHHRVDALRAQVPWPRARCSSRTRCPGRCGSDRCRAPRRCSAPAPMRRVLRPRSRRSSSSTASPPRTRRRTCRRT